MDFPLILGFGRQPLDNMGLSDLPVELSTRVYRSTTHVDLCTLCRVSKRVRKVAVSVLYTKIDLDNVRSAMKCLQTLARSGALANEVGVLSLQDFGDWHLAEPDKAHLYQYLVKTLSRATNLRCYTCRLRSYSGFAAIALTHPFQFHDRLKGLCFHTRRVYRPARLCVRSTILISYLCICYLVFCSVGPEMCRHTLRDTYGHFVRL